MAARTAIPTPPANATYSTVQVGTYNVLTDSFTPIFDLNDRVNTYMHPKALQMPAPDKDESRSSNIRTSGESIIRENWKNRHVIVEFSVRDASPSALVARVHALIAAIETVPYTLRLAFPGATQYSYADVVKVTHDIPTDTQQINARGLSRLHIDFECQPGLRGDRLFAQNWVLNPGFEAGSGPGVQVFNDTFANANAYASQAGSAPTAGSVAGTFVDLVMALSPLRYFRLGEAAGTVAYDTSGQGQNGTISGGPTLGATGSVSGDSGDKAITFAGGAQMIAGADTGLPSGNGSWSVLCAFKIAALPGAFTGFVTWGTNSNNQRVEVGITNTNHVYGGFGGGTSAAQGGTPSTGAYHLVIVTFDGTNLRLYLDGSLAAGPTAATGGIVLNSLRLAQFFAGTATTLNGQLDEVALFGAALSAGNVTALYNAWNAGTGLPTTTNTLTIASGARVAFGSPAWAAMNQWQARFRYTSGGDYRFYLHYTDANNWLRARVQASSLTLEHCIAGVVTTLATQTVLPASNTWYWLRVTQFPVPPAAGSGTADPPGVQAVLLNDSGIVVGTIGASVATAGPVATQDALTALVGRPQIEASGASLILGGPYSNVHSMSLFGPGGWGQISNAGTGVAAAAWEQDTTKTYPNGPVTSFGALRMDLAPAGTSGVTVYSYNGASPTGNQDAIPVQTITDVYGVCVWVRSSGLGSNGTVALAVAEFDVNGALLRQGTVQSKAASVSNAGWTQLAGTYTPGASCAYLGVLLSAVDTSAPGASAGAIIWWDNVQCWNQSQTGQTSMPYCELRFPQSPAQLVVSGIQGHMPAPAYVALGTYPTYTAFAPGNTITFALARRQLASANGRFVAAAQGFYGATLTPTATPILDATAYGGFYPQATVQTAGWNPRVFSLNPGDALGIYHILCRFKTAQTAGNLPNVQVRTSAPQQTTQWFNTSGQSDILSSWYGDFRAPLAAQNAWTLCDAGQVPLPPYPQGALNDATRTWITPRAQWRDITGGGSVCAEDWAILLPINGELLSGQLINASNSLMTVSGSWLWCYFDPLGYPTALSQSFAWTASVETTSAPNPAAGAGGVGTNNTGYVGLNIGAEPYLTLDPTVDAGSAAGQAGVNQGVNQFAGFMTNNAADVMPMLCEIQYSPLYLYPRP